MPYFQPGELLLGVTVPSQFITRIELMLHLFYPANNTGLLMFQDPVAT